MFARRTAKRRFDAGEDAFMLRMSLLLSVRADQLEIKQATDAISLIVYQGDCHGDCSAVEYSSKNSGLSTEMAMVCPSVNY